MTCTPTTFPYATDVLVWVKENLRSDALDLIAKGLSFIGSEEFMLIFLCLCLWSFGFKKTRSLIFITLFSTIFNLALKLMFQECRPDLSLRLVEATGYSMPSGHAQISGTLWGWLLFHSNSFFIQSLLSLLIVLVSLSRIYLGVHYLHNIITGAIIGLFLAWSFRRWHRRLFMWIQHLKTILFIPLSLTFCLLCSYFLGLPDNFDGEKLCGAFFVILYCIHQKQSYRVKNTHIMTVCLNIFLGFLGIAVIRTYTQTPLLWLGLPESYAHFFRYALICFWGLFYTPKLAFYIKSKVSKTTDLQ